MGLIMKNRIAYAGSPSEIDAKTVNGHTVESDVPVDAVFTDTVNSDITAEGNPVILTDLQGGVPFSEIIVKGENIVGQETVLTATGKNQLPITVTSGTGAGVTYTVDNDEITVSGTTTGVATIIISAPNMTITEDMRLSYRGNLSGITPKATILRNGETLYPTPNSTVGSKLLAGDVLQNVYIQQQSTGVAVSGSAKFQLEYGTEVTEYEKYSSETCTFTPDDTDYVIPADVIQKEGINVLTVNADEITLSVTGVRKNAAVAKLWGKSGGESYDDTEIRADVDKKLDKDGDASLLSYLSPNFSVFQPSERGIEMGEYDSLGFILEHDDFLGVGNEGKPTRILFMKEIDGVIYIGGTNGFGTMSKDMTAYTPILYTSDYGHQLDILDVEMVKNFDGDISWAMTVKYSAPYHYNPKEGILSPIECESSLSPFQPTKIVKDSTGNINQARIYFVQSEPTAQIGYCESDLGYIMRDVIFQAQFYKSGSLSDFIAFDDEGRMRMFCTIGTDIFFKIDRQQWECLGNTITYPWAEWGNTIVQKLYYDKTIDEYNFFAFIYNQDYQETTIMAIPYMEYYNPDRYEIRGSIGRIIPGTNTFLFGKEGSLFIFDGAIVCCLYDKTTYGNDFVEDEKGHIENTISGINSFIPCFVFNKGNQNYYFSRNEDRIGGLSYEKENRTLSYGLGKVDEAVSIVEMMNYEVQDLKTQIEELQDILRNNGLMDW